MIGGGTIGVSQGVDFATRARLGLEPRFQPVYFRGRNPSIDTAGLPADVWPAPGGVREYPFLGAAAALQIVSDSASDTAAGTGARVVAVSGLSASWDVVVQFVTMAGTTPVALATPLLRVNEVIAVTAGSSGSNVGTISVSAVSGGAIVAQIAPADGVSFSGVFSIPAGQALLVNHAVVSIQRSSAAAEAEVGLQIRDAVNGGSWFEPLSIAVHTQGTTSYQQSVVAGAILGGWDVRFRCRDVTNNGTRITVAAFGELYDAAA